MHYTEITGKSKKISFSGVSINPLTFQEAFLWAETILNVDQESSTVVVTPNPEMVVVASKNPMFQQCLVQADLALPDGFGLQLVGKLIGYSIPCRISGIDFIEYVLEHYSVRPLSVFVLGGYGNTAYAAAKGLRMRFPQHSFQASSGSPTIRLDGRFQNTQEETIIQEIRQCSPDLLLVGFGAPKQELWMHHYKNQISSVKIAIGIGGALEIWASKKKRAPGFMRMAGFEWLWRLLLEPKRAKRIFNAVIVFPLLIFKSRISHHLHL